MFCGNCGYQMPDGTRFCPSCGTPVTIRPQSAFKNAMEGAAAAAGSAAAAAGQAADQAGKVFESAADDAKEAFRNAGQSVDSAVAEVGADLRGEWKPGEPLKTDRSLASYILLSLITCGIYSYYFIYAVARDINIACEDDDEETAGLGMFILLSIVTCGFYGLYWEYKLGNRLAKNGPAYGLNIMENGTTIIMWRILGSLICFVGTFIGSNILIKNVNAVCAAYNRKNGLA